MRPNPTATATVAVAAALLLVAAPVRSDPTTQPAKGNATITGHVNDPTGKPAPKAMIKLTALNNAGQKTDDTPPAPGKKKKTGPAGPTTMTDDNGDFKLDGLAPGRYSVSATLVHVGHTVANVTLIDGQTTDVKIQLIKSKNKPASPTT